MVADSFLFGFLSPVIQRKDTSPLFTFSTLFGYTPKRTAPWIKPTQWNNSHSGLHYTAKMLDKLPRRKRPGYSEERQLAIFM
jgi:hypothetical protein